MATAHVVSDDELLAAIGSDLRTIYSDVIREPLPEKIAAALYRRDFRAANYEDESARSGSGIQPRMCRLK